MRDGEGASAVEFIICHAEVTIAFVEEKKIPELLKTFPNTTKYLRTIVSFGKVTPEQREEVEKFGLTIYSWDEFLLLVVRMLKKDGDILDRARKLLKARSFKRIYPAEFLNAEEPNSMVYSNNMIQPMQIALEL